MFKNLFICLCLLVFLSACDRSAGLEEEKEVDKVIFCEGYLSECSSKVVKREGMVSDVIWQHTVGPQGEYTYYQYVDLSYDIQTLIYTKSAVECEAGISFTGKVVEISGPTQSPGEPGSKVDDSYKEYHVLADDWECLD